MTDQEALEWLVSQFNRKDWPDDAPAIRAEYCPGNPKASRWWVQLYRTHRDDDPTSYGGGPTLADAVENLRKEKP